jgi:hypothetical protein
MRPKAVTASLRKLPLSLFSTLIGNQRQLRYSLPGHRLPLPDITAIVVLCDSISSAIVVLAIPRAYHSARK